MLQVQMTIEQQKIRTFLVDETSKDLQLLGLVHEAAWIVEFVMKKIPPRGEWQESAKREIKKIIERRGLGEPLAYIIESWAFRSHEFSVGPGVLIPRPETEELVENAFTWAIKNINFSKPIKIVDLGAGSGCIGLSLGLELAQHIFSQRLIGTIEVILVEDSPAALVWLKKNVQKFKSQKIPFQIKISEEPWSKWPIAKCQILLSNPPYLSEAELDSLDNSVRKFEPISALVPKNISSHVDASGPYREIIEIAEKSLEVGGLLAFELGINQPKWIEKFTAERKTFTGAKLLKDMAGKDRFLLATRNSDG